GGRENRLGRHYSRFSAFWPAPALAGQSLALRKLCDAGSNRRSRVSGGCAKPIFDHAHERSAKRQGKRGLILCPLSSNLPCRARRVELRLQQRRKTEEAGFELVWGFSCQVVVLGFAESSLFGAGKPFFIPSPAVRFPERA